MTDNDTAREAQPHDRSRSRSRGGRWVGSWACGPQLTEPQNLPPEPGLAYNTLRQVVFPTLAGSRVRLRLSNEFGDAPVTMNAVYLANSTSPANEGGSGIELESSRALSFAGHRWVTIPAGEARVSDPLDYPLQPFHKLAISIDFGEVPVKVTGHPGSRTTSYLHAGNVATATHLEAADGSPTQRASIDHWYYISGLDVLAGADSAAVVAFGDSLTDGRGSTTNANDRWPDLLARRLWADPSTKHIAVLNQGIGGNSLVHGGLGPTGVERFTRDVLEQRGVRWLIVLEGVNDIGGSDDRDVAQALIAAYQQLIDRAHAREIAVFGMVLLPFGGSHYDSPTHRAARQRVNDWIRKSGAFDAIIDLERVVADPTDPARLRPDFDSGDQLHLSAAGYRAMAEAIDLGLFRSDR